MEVRPVGIQLSHGGRNAIPPQGIARVAPSAIAYGGVYGMPVELTFDGIKRIIAPWADAARRAVTAGFDLIEVHAAHGYLIHQFLSPITNKRTDEYGGTFANCGRLLREIFSAVRDVVGPDYPLIARVSASDYHPEGVTPAIISEHMRELLPIGLAAVDVSSGGLLPVFHRTSVLNTRWHTRPKSGKPSALSRPLPKHSAKLLSMGIASSRTAIPDNHS